MKNPKSPPSRCLVLGFAVVAACALNLSPMGIANAGANINGGLLVHTDDAYSWTDDVCDNYDAWVPPHCFDYNTRTDKDESAPALIWFIASFFESSNPAVTLVYFGNDHNLPEDSHDNYGYCGPPGSLEVPDPGWPDSPFTAGNSVAFSYTLTDTDIPFYCVSVYGFEGAYYGTGINPGGGYAGFADDSVPPIIDECQHFGRVRWYEQGYNDAWMCMATWGACCWIDGTCTVIGQADCMVGGQYAWYPHVECEPDPCPPWGACCRFDDSCFVWPEDDCDGAHETWLEGIPCDPNPCGPTSDVSEMATEIMTWGSVKSTYK